MVTRGKNLRETRISATVGAVGESDLGLTGDRPAASGLDRPGTSVGGGHRTAAKTTLPSDPTPRPAKPNDLDETKGPLVGTANAKLGEADGA